MRKHILMVCVSLAAAISLNGCFNDEIRVNSFEELCKVSGGTIDNGNAMQCWCGEGERMTPCAVGVVCISINKKLECASSTIRGTSCEPCDTDNKSDCHETRCENGVLLYCVSDDDGKYTWGDVNGDVYKCGQDVEGNEDVYSCKDIYSCGECLNGSISCIDDNVVVCNEGKFELSQEIPLCEDKIIEGVYMGGRKPICINGKYINSECKDKEGNVVSCTSGECGVCLNGNVRCNSSDDGAKIEICRNGLWEFASYCDTQICHNDGKKCAECEPNERKCNNGMIQTCVNGSWDEPKSCGENKSCKNNKECGECQDEDSECLNNAWRKCTSGVWSDFMACPSNYDCRNDGKTCGVCNSSQFNLCLNDKTLGVSCENGVWSESKTCEAYCESGKCAPLECNTNEVKCVDGDSGAEILTCVEGKWKADKCLVASSAVSCKGKICGECLNGISYEDVDNVCVQYNCILGVESSFTDSNGHSCLEKDGKFVSFGKCKNGESKISNNSSNVCVTETCINGDWRNPKINETGYSCSVDGEGNLIDAGECHNEDVKFEHLADTEICLQSKCIDGKWIGDELYNPNQYSCLVEDTKFVGMGNCKNGDIDIMNDSSDVCVTKLCVNGSWVIKNKNENEYSCSIDNDGKLFDEGECHNNKIKFEHSLGTEICVESKCVDGKWTVSKMNNPNEYSCREVDGKYVGIGECLNRQNYYYNENSSGYCEKSKCISGELVLLETKSVSCNSEKTNFGNCLNGWFDYTNNPDVTQIDSMCVIQKTQKCVNAVWKSLQEATGNTVIHCYAPCIISENDLYIKCQ